MARKRSSLGKGLGALLGEDFENPLTPVSANEPMDGQLSDIAIANISPDRQQPRTQFDQASIDELAQSIRQQGVIQPIIVRSADDHSGTGYYIIAGERRWRAAQKAGLDTIPALIRHHDRKDCTLVGLLENIQRENLNSIEISEALNTLSEQYHLSHSAIAEALGMSRPNVTNLIRLADLQPSIKDMIHQGQLDMGHVRAVLSVEQQHRISLARHIASKQLNVRQAEALAKQWPMSKNKPQKEPAIDADIADFARKCSEELSVKVSIDHKPGGKGKLTIHYTSLEQLHHITAQMSPKLGIEKEITEDDPA